MRNALLNLLPALAAPSPSLFAIALVVLVLANKLSGSALPSFARVRIPSAR